jgi:membrane protease YdiL (CAAX protease family)
VGRRPTIRDGDGGTDETVRLAMVAGAWLGFARAFAVWGAPLLPRALAATLSLQSFLSIVLVTATALGLALAFVFLREPRAALGLGAPAAAGIGGAVLASPVVVVTSAWLGFQLALPTLLAEIAQGGREAAQRNTGEFGRAVVETHVVTTLVWAVLLTPIAEELLFRGAMWSLVERLFRGAPRAASGAAPPSSSAALVPDERGRRLGAGIAATVVTSAVFAWLHHDQPGGAGIVRVTQAACLGVALGAARHATTSIVPGVALHALFNLMTVARARHWFESPGWPKPLPIAALYWQIAAVCTPLLTLVWIHRARTLGQLDAIASIHLAEPGGSIDEAALSHRRDRALGGWRRLLQVETGRLVLEPEGDGESLTWHCRATLVTPLLFAVRPFATSALDRAMRAALARLDGGAA